MKDWNINSSDLAKQAGQTLYAQSMSMTLGITDAAISANFGMTTAGFLIVLVYDACSSLCSVMSVVFSFMFIFRSNKKFRSFAIGFISVIFIYLIVRYLEFQIIKNTSNTFIFNIFDQIFQIGLGIFPASLWGLIIGFGMKELNISFEPKDQQNDQISSGH